MKLVSRLLLFLLMLNLKGVVMTIGAEKPHDFSVNVLRRKDLVNRIKEMFPAQNGLVVLFAGFEEECQAFRQESSFYYLTGITEPGVVLVVDLQNKSTLYVPNCGPLRSKWIFSPVELVNKNAPALGLDAIEPLGAECAGYQFHPFFPQEEYSDLLKILKNAIDQKQSIFTLSPQSMHEYAPQRLLLLRLEKFLPALSANIIDVSPIIAQQRRVKDMHEIELMFVAAEITLMAHEAASQAIKPDILECEVQASLEYIFTASGGCDAFPSIVAGGKNSTILHYTQNKGVLKSGDLVVVDIGAKYNNYCADLTRTYPVSGKFTKRQRQVYDIVLECQTYIADLAQPGYWLNNKEVPEKSLNHLARAFMAKKGYEKYFIHGIGHYLGLDVHDVGDYKIPLQEGDVITIEPGIYIPEENLGVRIEDDYWLVKDGVVCLSEQLPKKAEDVERMMQEQLDEDDIEFEDDDEDFENMSQA